VHAKESAPAVDAEGRRYAARLHAPPPQRRHVQLAHLRTPTQVSSFACRRHSQKLTATVHVPYHSRQQRRVQLCRRQEKLGLLQKGFSLVPKDGGRHRPARARASHERGNTASFFILCWILLQCRLPAKLLKAASLSAIKISYIQCPCSKPGSRLLDKEKGKEFLWS
jgi:hypothetical protein